VTSTLSIALSPEHFKLKAPESDTLLQLRMNPYQMPDSFANALHLIPITLPEPITSDQTQMRSYYYFIDHYSEAIENDLNYYYPQNMPGSAVYLFRHHEALRPSPYLFGHGIVNFLNSYGHSLNVSTKQKLRITTDPFWYKGTLFVESTPIQLDNDLDIELLLYVYTNESGSTGISTYVPVNLTAQSQLQIIPNDFGYEHALGCTQVDITHDLNQDKQRDILFYCTHNGVGFSISQQIVASWSTEGVFRIGQTDSIFWTGEQVPYEVKVSDIDLDGFEEIVWMESCEENLGNQCEIVNTFSWDSNETYSEELGLMSGFTSECERLNDAFSVSGELRLCIFHLKRAIFAQTDPNILDKITSLLNYLPSSDPDAQLYREHLLYLLGYHYELIGEERSAVSTYLSLIQQSPASSWSWLAWARLELVN
jgi:hypothetical protein